MNKPVIKYTVCNVTLKKVYTIVWGQLDFLIIIKYFYFEAFFFKSECNNLIKGDSKVIYKVTKDFYF